MIKDESKLINMTIHQEDRIESSMNETTYVLRVKNGWIYKFYEKDENQAPFFKAAVFVPERL